MPGRMPFTGSIFFYPECVQTVADSLGGYITCLRLPIKASARLENTS